VDYLVAIFDPKGGGPFNFDVDVTELTKKRSDNTANFSGEYSAEPCPDVGGVAHASFRIRINTTSPNGFVSSNQVQLTVETTADADAKITSVHTDGRYFDEKLNGHGRREESRTRLVENARHKTLTAIVDNEGPYDKGALQKRADAVAGRAALLSAAVSQKLEAVWRDGTTCVQLTARPSSKNVEPRARFNVGVSATAKGGTEVDGPITASRSGGGKVSPPKSKKAPAAFDYTSPKKEGAIGRLTFEQTSKRGIGRATVEYTVCSKKKAGPGRAAPSAGAVCKRKAVPGTVTGTLEYHGQGGRGSLDVTLDLTLHTLDGTVDEPGRLAISDDSTYTFSYHGAFGCVATGSGKVSGLQGLVADRYVGSVTSNGGDLYWSIRLMDAAASDYRNGTASEAGTLPNRCEGTADYLTDPVFQIAANRCTGVNASFGFGFPYGDTSSPTERRASSATTARAAPTHRPR
jgi:hypothetical protein